LPNKFVVCARATPHMTANNRHVNAIRHVIEIIGLVGFIGSGFGVGVELENDRWRENWAYNLILFNALTFLTFF